MTFRWLALWRLDRLEKKLRVTRRSDDPVERMHQIGNALDDRFMEICDRAKILVHGLSPEITTDEQAEFFREIEAREDHRVTPESATDVWWLIVGLQYEGTPEDKHEEHAQMECDAGDLCEAMDKLLALRKRLDPSSSHAVLRPVG